MVSVLCITYNHEKYIAQALESIVTQKTSFALEVIVHDDASTDGTAAIVRKYAEQYPEIIVPIYQEKNQYSQRVSISREIMLPRSRGKYFAICEGDDFWTNINKLQKQFDYMESHPECTLCIHNAQRVNVEGQRIGEIAPVSSSRIVSCEEVILGGGDFCATNSIFAPTRLTHKLPEYFNILTNDLVWQIYLASQGDSYCFADEMSAYCTGVENSWTQRIWNNKEKRIRWLSTIKETYEAFDMETGYQYHAAVEDVILVNEISKCILLKNLENLKVQRYKEQIKKLPMKTKVFVWLSVHSPRLVDLYETFRHSNR